MTVAVGLFLYGTLVALVAPRVLPRLTRHGVFPQLGVLAWLALMVSVFSSWCVGLAVALVDITHIWFRPERLLVLGLHEAEEIAIGHAGVAAQLALIAATVALTVMAMVLTTRWARSHRRMRLRAREHAEALRLTGRPMHRHESGDVVVLDTAERAAYCVAGAPNVVVVTSGALAALEDSELAAVLAHEHAHLSGRHAPLTAVLRAIATTLPGLRLATAGCAEITRLLEMCADDKAAGKHGSEPLLGGLLAILGVSEPAPSGALAAAGTAVLARAERLVDPVSPMQRATTRTALLGVIAATVTGLASVAATVAFCSALLG